MFGSHSLIRWIVSVAIIVASAGSAAVPRFVETAAAAPSSGCDLLNNPATDVSNPVTSLTVQGTSFFAGETVRAQAVGESFGTPITIKLRVINILGGLSTTLAEIPYAENAILEYIVPADVTVGSLLSSYWQFEVDTGAGTGWDFSCTPAAEPSSGCNLLNDPSFDRLDLPTTTRTIQNVSFLAGETLRVQAVGAPSGSPTNLSLVITPGATTLASIPYAENAILEYVVPADVTLGLEAVGPAWRFRVDTETGTRMDFSCIPAPLAAEPSDGCELMNDPAWDGLLAGRTVDDGPYAFSAGQAVMVAATIPGYNADRFAWLADDDALIDSAFPGLGSHTFASAATFGTLTTAAVDLPSGTPVAVSFDVRCEEAGPFNGEFASTRLSSSKSSFAILGTLRATDPGHRFILPGSEGVTLRLGNLVLNVPAGAFPNHKPWVANLTVDGVKLRISMTESRPGLYSISVEGSGKNLPTFKANNVSFVIGNDTFD